MRAFFNLGSADRGVRILGGGGMLALGLLHWVPGVWGPAFLLFGWFPLVTGLFGWCPFYVLLGCRTRAPRQPGKEAPEASASDLP